MTHIYNQVASSVCFLLVDNWIAKDLFIFELSLHVLVNADKIPLNSLWAFCFSNYTVLLFHFFSVLFTLFIAHFYLLYFRQKE